MQHGWFGRGTEVVKWGVQRIGKGRTHGGGAVGTTSLHGGLDGRDLLQQGILRDGCTFQAVALGLPMTEATVGWQRRLQHMLCQFGFQSKGLTHVLGRTHGLADWKLGEDAQRPPKEHQPNQPHRLRVWVATSFHSRMASSRPLALRHMVPTGKSG